MYSYRVALVDERAGRLGDPDALLLVGRAHTAQLDPSVLNQLYGPPYSLMIPFQWITNADLGC